MDDLPVHHICGLTELGSAPLGGARRIISILDPAAPEPPELQGIAADVLTLRFDDAIVPCEGLVPPTSADIERLLAFDRAHDVHDGLVIHCTAGISRSTAALVILLAQRRGRSDPAIFAELRTLRPMAWPNSLMIALADAVLGLEGRLVRDLREHYKVQLRTHPHIGRMMIGLGRESELPFDRLRP